MAPLTHHDQFGHLIQLYLVTITIWKIEILKLQRWEWGVIEILHYHHLRWLEPLKLNIRVILITNSIWSNFLEKLNVTWFTILKWKLFLNSCSFFWRLIVFIKSKSKTNVPDVALCGKMILASRFLDIRSSREIFDLNTTQFFCLVTAFTYLGAITLQHLRGFVEKKLEPNL